MTKDMQSKSKNKKLTVILGSNATPKSPKNKLRDPGQVHRYTQDSENVELPG